MIAAEDRIDRGKVAVVIPVVDRALELGRALASVRAQTRKVDQVVVVDDASAVTLESRYCWPPGSTEQLSIVRVDTKLGASAARNLGMECTTAEFVFFLDSDDLWSNNHVWLSMAELSNPGELVVSSSVTVSACGRVFVQRLRHLTPKRVLRRRHGICPTSAFALRRDERTSSLKFNPDLAALQDYAFLVSAIELGVDIRTQPAVTVVRMDPLSGDRVFNSERAVGAALEVRKQYGALLGTRTWTAMWFRLAIYRDSRHRPKCKVFGRFSTLLRTKTRRGNEP